MAEADKQAKAAEETGEGAKPTPADKQGQGVEPNPDGKKVPADGKKGREAIESIPDVKDIGKKMKEKGVDGQNLDTVPDGAPHVGTKPKAQGHSK